MFTDMESGSEVAGALRGFIAGAVHVHLQHVEETAAAPSPLASRHAICLQVHKSKAVVRFMFHNPDDVRWFRPVELWTKAGRRGRIREPVSGSGEGGWRGWRARTRGLNELWRGWHVYPGMPHLSIFPRNGVSRSLCFFQ